MPVVRGAEDDRPVTKMPTALRQIKPRIALVEQVVERVRDGIFGGEFPWGTLAANLIGCFLAGAFWSVAESRLSISGQTRTIVLMGFMGAFTTFSAFMLETGQLVRDAQWSWALGNVALQNCCGIVLFFCGLAVGRLI